MNFLSHYFRTQDKPTYLRVANILPDLYPKFSMIHNSFFKKFEPKNLQSQIEKELWDGIALHYTDDNIFHQLPDFKFFISFTMAYFNKNKYLKEIERKNFVGHIFFEMLLDHLVIVEKPNILEEFYNDLSDVKLDVICQFFSKITQNDKSIEIFKANYLQFLERKYMYHYTKSENLPIGLEKITGKAGKWKLSPNILEELIIFANIMKQKYTIAVIQF